MENEKRNRRNRGLVKKATKLMEADAGLCGDDSHALAVIMIKDELGLDLTKEQISVITTIASVRRAVFKKNPDLNERSRTTKVLHPNDAKFYGCAEQGTKGFIPYKSDKEITPSSLFDE